MILLIGLLISAFIITDIVMTRYSIEGRYYFNHFVGNMLISYNTFNCLCNCYVQSIICNNDMINVACCITYSLHLYHILWYYNKLRKDDWLHHILMVGIALPLSNMVNKNFNIIGHTLFFTTGLPGGIDYILLFLVRNNIIDKMIEKNINRYINVWLRCPGCIAAATLILVESNKYSLPISEQISCYIVIGSIYWNGIYFMNQVVSNYERIKQ
jgi:hypothetical protein